MKHIWLWIFAAAMTLGACRKDYENSSTDILYPVGGVWVKTSVTGLVRNQDGLPISGAVVRAGNKTTQTDQNGVFSLRDVIVNSKGAYIKVQHPNYMHGSRTLILEPGTRNRVEIELLSNAATRFVNAASGGNADYGDYRITLPAGGIVTASGQPYSGEVGVAAHWLDPTDSRFNQRMPGRLEGIRMDGSVSGMVSMGMVAVELRDASGARLQIKPGHEAEIRLRVPQSLQSVAPATIPLWHFDEDKGVWIEEGQAVLQSGFYVGKVSHFSFWNCDYPWPLVKVTICIKDQNNQGIPNLKVYLVLGPCNTGSGWTDDNGCVSGLVPKDEALQMLVYLDSPLCSNDYQPLLNEPVGPFSSDVNLSFTINLQSVPNLITIKGQLLDCNDQPVSNGYVYAKSSQLPLYGQFGATDANGFFEIAFVNCSNAATAIDLQGFDMAAMTTTPKISLPLANAVIDLGPWIACNQQDDYMTITVNGNTDWLPFVFIKMAMDSVGPGGSIVDVISVGASGPNGIFAGFYMPGDVMGPGMYPGFKFGAFKQPPNGYFLECPFVSGDPCVSVTVTEFNGIGGIIAGIYSGTASDQGMTPTPVSGTFRGILKP